MHRLKVSHKVSLSLFAVFSVVSITIYPNQVAMAVPLPAGDYEIINGDLIGGSFSITATGEYSAWELTYPANSYNPVTTFDSSDPSSPPPSVNEVINGFSRLTIFASASPVFYTLNTGSHELSPGQLSYDYLVVYSMVGPLGDGGGAVALTTIPEPSSLLLIGTGLLGLAGYRRSQCRREPTQLG